MQEADRDRPSGRVEPDDFIVRSPCSAAAVHHESSSSDEDPRLPAPLNASPPPLLPSVTSPPEVVVGHVTSPVATAAIWTAAAVLPGAGRSGGGEFSETSGGGYHPSTAEQSRAYGEEMTAATARLPYHRDLVYPGGAYPGDLGGDPPPAWTGPYYTRVSAGGHLSADLPPGDPAASHVHHHSLVMTSCDPTPFQVTDDWINAQ